MSPLQENLNRTDSLSSVGRQLLRLDAATAYSRLVVDSGGNEAARIILQTISSRDLLEGPITSDADADAVMAGMWLRHDWLDESHRISQRLDNPTGSFWHAIMHRREGDFSNSKYWYHRVDGHPSLAVLAARAADAINQFPADKSIFRIVAQGWSPAAFVDLVEQVHDRPADPRRALAGVIQELEWQTLFEHCTRAAAGR